MFGGSRGVVRAVDDISFAIESGQTLGVVGESGCGKTTTAKLVLGLEEPTGGSIRFEGRDLQELDTAGRRHYRKSVQAVFQDPYASLSPRMRISDIIAEPLVTNENPHGAATCASACCKLLDLVGLPETIGRSVPARVLRRSATAHRHRAGAGAVAEADRAGRAGLGARRVDPRADPEPAARSAGAVGAVVPVHRARPRRGRAHEPHDRGDVSGQDRRDRRRADACARRRSIPTPRRCSPPHCRAIRTSGARRSFCRARCQAR